MPVSLYTRLCLLTSYRSSIGIGFSSKNVPLSRIPGWEPESWAYHGDDGQIFCCQSTGKAYSTPFTAGDVIGCGVNFRTGAAFFTKNGDHLGMHESSDHYQSYNLCSIKRSCNDQMLRLDIQVLRSERLRGSSFLPLE